MKRVLIAVIIGGSLLVLMFLVMMWFFSMSIVGNRRFEEKWDGGLTLSYKAESAIFTGMNGGIRTIRGENSIKLFGCVFMFPLFEYDVVYELYGTSGLGQSGVPFFKTITRKEYCSYFPFSVDVIWSGEKSVVYSGEIKPRSP